MSMVQYILTLPGADITAANNAAIIAAASNNRIQMFEYLLTLPKIDVSAQNNAALFYANEHLPIVAMLLYFEPKVAASLRGKRYIKYRNKLLSPLRIVTHKIAVSLTDLPTPILIEIIEQAVDFAIYIPYHIKWNMVVAIKHNKHIKK